MMSFELRQLLHKFILHDMAIQSLHRDYKVIENLKMSNIYIPILDRLLKAISNDYYNLKRLLAKNKIRVVKWENVDDYFSDLTDTMAGEDATLRYAKQALKTQVEHLLISYMHN